MKLTAKTDLDAPAAFVYAALADHPAWEREAAGRGISIQRPADLPPTGPGSGWLLQLPYRGKTMNVLLRLVQAISDEMLAFDFESHAIEGEFDLSVMALSARRTRLRLVLEVRPRTLAARLLLNTLRLARGRMETRLETRLQQVAARIEGRLAGRVDQPSAG